MNKHGLSKHPIYIVWQGIKRRCYYRRSNMFHRYGGRGIEMCAEWRNDFAAFYKWAIANEWQKGLHVDRRDNDGFYSPNNCRIVTPTVNANNRSTNVRYEYNGKMVGISELELISNGISRRQIYLRLLSGWTVEEAISKPLISDIQDLPITINGVTQTVRERRKELNMTVFCLHNRLSRGMNIVDALTIPKQKYPAHINKNSNVNT